MARAVVHHAQVFLFDEPLSNLDAKLRLEARGFLKHLQHEIGVTTVYVTHDQAEAMALADRMAIMDRGKVIQVGTPAEVYRRPATTFVASFLGSPPVNLFPCRLDRSQRALLLNGGTLDLTEMPAWAPVLGKEPDGTELVLGVRPEHLSVHDAEMPQSFPGEMYVTQPLGAETLLLLQVGDTTGSVRLFTDDPPRLSGRVWLQPDLRRVFLYRAGGELVE